MKALLKSLVIGLSLFAATSASAANSSSTGTVFGTFTEYFFPVQDPGESTFFPGAVPTFDAGAVQGPVSVVSGNSTVYGPCVLGCNETVAFAASGVASVTVNIGAGGVRGIGFYYGAVNTPISPTIGVSVFTTLGGATPDNYSISFAQAIGASDSYQFVGFLAAGTGKITQVVFTRVGDPDSVAMRSVLVTAVPEPSLPLMLVVGLGLIGMVVRRKGA